MPANVEIKAKLRDRQGVEATVARLCDSGPELIRQEDVFFQCPGARLKLRVFSPDSGELIRYERDDRPETRVSRYQIARTSDPMALLDILTTTLGETGIVRKERTLYLIGQTRVHLDRVEALGDFLELEVVLRPGQSEAEGKAIADGLLSAFGIGSADLLSRAYADMLPRQP